MTTTLYFTWSHYHSYIFIRHDPTKSSRVVVFGCNTFEPRTARLTVKLYRNMVFANHLQLTYIENVFGVIQCNCHVFERIACGASEKCSRINNIIRRLWLILSSSWVSSISANRGIKKWRTKTQYSWFMLLTGGHWKIAITIRLSGSDNTEWADLKVNGCFKCFYMYFLLTIDIAINTYLNF